MKIAIIGDVHANAEALGAALTATDRAGYDLRVILGDILTYGAEVPRTLDLVCDSVSRAGNHLLRGNHDEIYRRMIEDSTTPTGIASWVEEHILWTAPQIPVDIWRDLPFIDELKVAQVFFSHANPFGRGNWAYLADAATKAHAAHALRARGARLGVFGHTHRASCFALRSSMPEGEELGCAAKEQRAAGDCTYVVNAGSVGQPRCQSNREVVLWLSIERSGLLFHFQPIAYDVEAHQRAIAHSTMPDALKAKCLSYYP